MELKSQTWYDSNLGISASSIRTNALTSHVISKMHDISCDIRIKLGHLLTKPSPMKLRKRDIKNNNIIFNKKRRFWSSQYGHNSYYARPTYYYARRLTCGHYACAGVLVFDWLAVFGKTLFVYRCSLYFSMSYIFKVK